MKCRYDLTRQCTVDCEKIRACAWMADENRRKRLGAGNERKATAPVREEAEHETDRDSGKDLGPNQRTNNQP